MDPCTEFVRIKRDGWTALVHPDRADAVAAALIGGEGCVSTGKGGRGTVMRFPCGAEWGILRKYQRGGFIRLFLKEYYFLVNRPLRELRIHCKLHAAGLPVPEPLGVCWQWRGPFVRGAIATVEIPAPNLFEYLGGEPADAIETLRRCGQVIRQMHDLDVFHADLQVRNVLVSGERVYLIDFDNAQYRKNLTPLERARNLLRLRRSIEKNSLPLAHFQPICEGYGIDALPLWLERIYKAKGRVSDAMQGKRL